MSAVAAFRSAHWAPLLAMLLLGVPTRAQAPTSQRLTFDIPAQRVGTALARFAEVSGVDVLLDEPLAGGRRSTAVVGSFSPPQALAIMLDGTGLTARFTSNRSAVIVPAGRGGGALGPDGASAGGGAASGVVALDVMRVTARRVIGSPSRAVDPTFVLTLAGRIRRHLLATEALTPGASARIRIETRIRPDGTLHDVRILEQDGGDRGDRRLLGALEGAPIGLEPPPALRQPLMFDVMVR